MTFVIPSTVRSKTCKPTNPIGLRIGGLVLVILGFVLLANAWRLQDLANRSQTWPTTTGHVINATVEKSKAKGDRRFAPVVRFAYVVDGQSYESDRFAASTQSMSREAAETRCREHPPGREVQVHYDPAQPSMALLRLGPARETAPLGIAAAIALALGAFLFTRSLGMTSPTPAPPAMTSGAETPS